MKTPSLLIAAVAAMSLGVCSCSKAPADNILRTPVPERPAGQQDMVGYRAEPLDSVRVGFIGLGMRGPDAVRRFTLIPGTSVKALCDKHPDRLERSQKFLERASRPAADTYTGDEGWKELCQRPDIDLVYIATDWVNHVPMAVYAMQQGKHVAVEVPAATSLQECWALVDASERTRRHCMMLENCIYDFFELTTLNMAQQGLFGDILHVEGSYIHNLDQFWGQYEGNWRLDFNQKHRGDVYATHGMGPAAQLVDLHRGNRMTYLTAMDSKALTGPKMVAKYPTGTPDSVFANADHTMTMIQTAKGQTIHIQHDVMNPRPYSRMYQLTGTRGFANKYPVEGYAFAQVDTTLDAVKNYDKLNSHNFVPDDVRAQLMEKYKHPIQVELEESARAAGGHGGMDYIMDYRLVYCLLHGLPLDQDVYDAAEWSCLGELSRLSIENNSAPVEVPDFTRGAWQKLDGYHHYMAGE